MKNEYNHTNKHRQCLRLFFMYDDDYYAHLTILSRDMYFKIGIKNIL